MLAVLSTCRKLYSVGTDKACMVWDAEVSVCVCPWQRPVSAAIFVCPSPPLSLLTPSCVCRCACVSLCVSLFACLSVRVSLCVSLRVSVCLYVCVRVCVCVHIDQMQAGARVRRLKGHSDFVNSVAAAYHDDNTFVTGSDDGTIKVWQERETRTHTRTHTHTHTRAHTDARTQTHARTCTCTHAHTRGALSMPFVAPRCGMRGAAVLCSR